MSLAEEAKVPNVVVLGDSRAFDTYYTNSKYQHRYGYEKTFPHLWRKAALRSSGVNYDVVHIPDHFRGGTIENNIVRIALSNPAVVVILDGIWETLINKGHFLKFVERELREFDASAGREFQAMYSTVHLAALYKREKLLVSPQLLAARARQLVSYFRRRQRQVVWLTLPVPPRDYIGSTYHAGDYQPIPEWDDCLSAANAACCDVMQRYDCHVCNLTDLMEKVGGPTAALIDQWHFSPAFHAALAEKLDLICRPLVRRFPDEKHVSHDYMLGSPDDIPPDDLILRDGPGEDEVDALRALRPEQILIYRSELTEIANPRGNDRAEFEKQGAG